MANYKSITRQVFKELFFTIGEEKRKPYYKMKGLAIRN